MKDSIKYDFQRDNYYAEIKEQDMLNNRLSVLGIVDAYVGKYYSVEWIRKNVLRQTEDEIKEMDAQMSAEGEIAQAAEDEVMAQDDMRQQKQQAVDQKIANNQAQQVQNSIHKIALSKASGNYLTTTTSQFRMRESMRSTSFAPSIRTTIALLFTSM